jgi:formylglycine-generating enzyme required for sulfatase activity
MGDDAPDRLDERPAHQVTVRAFAAGRTEVTRAQYAVFAKETGRGATGPCSTDPDRDGRWESIADAS